MSEALVLPIPTPGRYETEGELTESLGRKGTPEPGPDLYPRDGTEAVTRIEAAMSELTIPGQNLNVITSSGINALGGAVRYALQKRGREGVERSKLGHQNRAYTQSVRIYESLRYMGIRAVGFDPGDSAAVDRLFDQGVDVIATETVSNTPESSVLDLAHFLGRLREAGQDGPIAVIDHTIALKTGIDLEEWLDPNDRVLVTESATKGAMHNSEHLGVVYSLNEELMNDFRRYKATEGLVTSTHADAAILRALEATIPGFHERNRALYASTDTIAVAAARAQEELGADAEFTVSFPTFSDHPNHEYAKEHLKNGVSPVVFLDCVRWDDEDAARGLLKRIAEHPRIEEQIREGQIYLGQSFGFPEATLLYDPNASQVRIAGGYNIDSDALSEALFEALTDGRT